MNARQFGAGSFGHARRGNPNAKWIFRSRAVSDWSYVFYEKTFDTEAEARAEFESHKANAKEHGGAGSLHTDNVQVARFSHWCPND